MKIIVPRTQLQVFRAVCRKVFPCETIAMLRGERTTEGVIIHGIVPIPHRANENGIGDYTKDLVRAKMAALRKGSELVGSIHSHCDPDNRSTCEHMSVADIRSGVRDGELVCGIVYVWDGGHRTEVHWYQPVALPEVEYK